MRRIYVVLFLALLLNACSFVNLKKDLQSRAELAHISIQVDGTTTNQNNWLVLLAIDTNGTILRDYRILRGKQERIDFVLLPSIYTFYIFDQEKNTALMRVNLQAQEHREISINFSTQGSQKNYVLIEELQAKLSFGLHNGMLYNGDVVPLQSKIFDDKNVKKGLWQSYQFVQDVPFGIFLEQEYDPQKKVVLFVHGISGSPRNFSYLIQHLDHSKYQVFYAFYPTGVDLNRASDYLAMVTSELQMRYGFTKLAIVAHSMGGLVSRAMLNKLKTKYKMNDIVDVFVTISSPLDGDKRADYGVYYAPVIMPSVKDIAHSSHFIQQLYTEALEEQIKYYLIFGYLENKADDGVVSIASQLRLEAQEEARKVRGYNKSHMEILHSNKVREFLNSILD